MSGVPWMPMAPARGLMDAMRVVLQRQCENIRYHRESRGMTLRQLSDVVGVSIAAIAKYEVGTMVPARLVTENLDAFFMQDDVCSAWVAMTDVEKAEVVGHLIQTVSAETPLPLRLMRRRR